MKESLVAATIIVALAGFVGYHKIYARHQAQRTQLLAELQSEEEQQRAAADVAQVYQQIERYRERLSPTKDTSWLLNEIVTIADASGVQLTTITPEAPNAIGPFTRLAVSLQFTASYHELGSFLDRLENAKPFFRVDQLSVAQTQADESSDSTVASIQLVLSTLYAPPPLPPVEGGGAVELSGGP